MGPSLCNYYVTLRCNSRCEFCNIWREEKNRNIREQDESEIRQNLRDLKKLGVRFIDFTGGEPLLYKNIVYALGQAKTMGFITTLTTNTILYEKRAEEIRGMVDMLNFSLESPVEEEHNSACGVKSFNKVMESIRIAKQIGERVKILYTVTDKNFRRVPEMIGMAQKMKCPVVLNPCFSYFGNSGISKDSLKWILNYFYSPYVILNPALFRFVISGGNDTKKPACRAMKSAIVISPDNFMMLPCFHHCIERIKIEGNLFEIRNSEHFRNIIKGDGKFGFCQGCAINCYLRASLLSSYPLSFMAYVVKYGIESMRQQLLPEKAAQGFLSRAS